MSDDKTKRRLDDDQNSKTELLHELQVHQVELEAQNQELRETQQELEEVRDRYANLYDFAPVGYFTMDLAGVVRDINLTGAALLGKERMNISGQPFSNFLARASVQSFLAHLRNTAMLPGNSRVEVMLQEKNGAYRTVNLESTLFTADESMCRTVMIDITEQRHLAVALQVNRAAQNALLSSIPALVFYLDKHLNFLNVSVAFADFFGMGSEELWGQSIHALYPENYADEFEPICKSVLATGVALFGYEHRVPNKDGELIFLSTVLAPYRDINGELIGLVGVSTDISMIKNAATRNSELLIQNRKLTRNLYTAIESERLHLARELHDELGQWLTAIQAEAQAIANNANNHEPEIHVSALAIDKSAKSVHEVIRGMLRQLRPALLDELGLADSLRELHKQWCRSHPKIACELQISVALDGLGEELNVTIYRLVQEALSNIASHAQAHRVAVVLECEEGQAGEANNILLNVLDDGAGFNKSIINKGIGILGMRERVIAVGGDFYIESTPGGGTNIQAKLPLPVKPTGKRKK